MTVLNSSVVITGLRKALIAFLYSRVKTENMFKPFKNKHPLNIQELLV